MNTPPNPSAHIVIFGQKNVRRHWDADRELWYFSIIDVIEVLTDTTNPRRYWSDLKIKLNNEGSEVYEKIVQLKMPAADGKKYLTDCFSTEDLFRVIQSIPSPQAEPFKVWLATVGYERMEETEDPELGIDRALRTYLKKGYSREWINQRLKSIEIRKELTNEWHERGVKEGREYAILTDEITQAWAGMNVKQYKKFKELKKQSLRDNMTNLELVLNMLAEASTTAISQKKLPKGFRESGVVAREGGDIAGTARRKLEQRLGKSVVSRDNVLQTTHRKHLPGK